MKESMEAKVAALDVWTEEVQASVRSCLPPGYSIEFARTYEPDEQLNLVRGCDVILTGWAAVTGEMIASAPRLRIIQKWGIGLDRIDLQAAQDAGIGLTITAGANASVVAEHALMLMLAVYRRLSLVDRSLRQGRWLFDQMRGVCRQVSGKTIGLVGFGRIGQALAQKLSGLNVKILYTDVEPRNDAAPQLGAYFSTLDELLEQSDIVSIHIPGGVENQGLFGSEAFQKMKPGSVLINVSRGDIVDEAALVAALKAGHLMGAGLDVFEDEPPHPDSPLLELDEVILTPHTAGSVIDNVPNVAQHAFGNVQKLFAGEPIAPADHVLPMRKS